MKKKDAGNPKKITELSIGACRWETNRIFHIYTMHLPGTGGGREPPAWTGMMKRECRTDAPNGQFHYSLDPYF